jgi:hypothetical protein
MNAQGIHCQLEYVAENKGGYRPVPSKGTFLQKVKKIPLDLSNVPLLTKFTPIQSEFNNVRSKLPLTMQLL